jgi:hypothetical protein
MTDDTSTIPPSTVFGGQLYIHHGMKRSTGNPAEKAGLTGGTLYGIKVAGMSNERTDPDQADFDESTPFSLVPLEDQSQRTGADLETESDSKGITKFARPEDAAWDPTNPNVLYLNTTNAFNLPSRLWKLTFENPADPNKGGTIEAVLDGSEGQQMLDNMGGQRTRPGHRAGGSGRQHVPGQAAPLRPGERLADGDRQARSRPVHDRWREPPHH